MVVGFPGRAISVSKCVEVESTDICVQSKTCHLAGEWMHSGEQWAFRVNREVGAGCRGLGLAGINRGNGEPLTAFE